MANIKNLQMWNDICTDARISINKSFLGLRTVAVYKPTGSVIDAQVMEFAAADGNRIRLILQSTGADIAQIIGDFRPEHVTNGNYLAEVCTSRDGAFLAVKLMQFSVLSYQSVTDVLTFEGDDARAVGKMLSAGPA